MPNFKVKNLSRGQRLVQVEAREGRKTKPGEVPRAKQVSLMPGEEKTLRMTGLQAQRYTQAAAAAVNPYLSVTPEDAEARAAVSGKDTGGLPEEPTSGDLAQSDTGSAAGPTAAQELLSRADGMAVEDLRTEARMVVGSSWPRRGGSELTREQIKDLLKGS